MFEVEWTATAANELAAVWIRATDKNAVTEASFAIDQTLTVDPTEVGESRTNEERITFVAPLGIRFHVDVGNQQVTVLACWLFTTKKS